jgi:hypothetical protein
MQLLSTSPFDRAGCQRRVACGQPALQGRREGTRPALPETGAMLHGFPLPSQHLPPPSPRDSERADASPRGERWRHPAARDARACPIPGTCRLNGVSLLIDAADGLTAVAGWEPALPHGSPARCRRVRPAEIWPPSPSRRPPETSPSHAHVAGQAIRSSTFRCSASDTISPLG